MSKLTMPSKNTRSRLEVPKSERFIVIKEEHGIKLVETDKDYMVIGKTIVYKYKSITWAAKKHEHVTKIHENLDV